MKMSAQETIRSLTEIFENINRWKYHIHGLENYILKRYQFSLKLSERKKERKKESEVVQSCPTLCGHGL